MAPATLSNQKTGSSGPSFPVSHFPLPFSEAELSRLWQDQTFPPEALTTAEGERLRVVYRGRRTGGPGPDFRDALIAARGGLLKGDIELHVRSSDFRRHGHHLDPGYAGVVLHLVFRDDDVSPTPLPGGGDARVVALAAWVEGRAQDIRGWLERPALWREPCHSALARSGGEAVGATLDRLGDMRFRVKTAALARRLADGDREADEALWQALLSALSYGGAGAEFGSLAQVVPWAPLRSVLLALPAGERAAEAHRLLSATVPILPAAGRGRPARPGNRPEDRCRGAAALAARFAQAGLAGAFVAALDDGGLDPQGDAVRLASTQAERRGTTRFPISNFAFRSAGRPRPESRAIAAMLAMLTVTRHIGRSRAIEMLANAVLPFLAALGPEGRARRAEALHAQLPLPARYGAVRHLHEAAGEMRVDFRRQQGMLYLLKQYSTREHSVSGPIVCITMRTCVAPVAF